MWVDAVRYYEAALDTGHLDPATRAEYEARAGVAAYRSIDPATATVHAERALDLAREHGFLDVWGEAALLRSRVPPAVTTGDARALHEFLDQVGSCEPELQAQVHARLSEMAFSSLRLGEARAEADHARSIATELHDHAILARVDFVEGLHRFGNLDFDTALSLFLGCEEHAQLARDSLLESWGLGRQPFVLLTDGRLDAAEETAARALRHNRTHGLWGEYALVNALRTGIAVAQGRVGTAERRAVDAAAALARTQLSFAASVLWGAAATARALIGDLAGASQAIEQWDAADPRTAALGRRLVSALGDQDGDRGHATGFRALSRPGDDADLLSVGVAAIDVELADALGAPDVASNALPILTAGYERGMRFSTGWILFVPRLAGVACLLLERYDDAETWLRRACADAEVVGAAGELARASYDLARTHHARHRVSAETDELLTSAIHEFARLGYRPLLSRARRLAGLPDDAGSGDSPSTRVILVTDLVDSTPLNRRVGDRRFVELLREHNQIVRSRLRQFDGVEFKHTGDGVGAWFLTARSAVQCALAIHDDMERFNATSPEPLQIRIGLSSGEVIANEGDLYGIAVIEAFRICDHATDGRVLVAPGIPALVRDATLGFRSIGDVALKGFPDAVPLYEVTPRRRRPGEPDKVLNSS
jgi:class 3 adenylate cyclase